MTETSQNNVRRFSKPVGKWAASSSNLIKAGSFACLCTGDEVIADAVAALATCIGAAVTPGKGPTRRSRSSM